MIKRNTIQKSIVSEVFDSMKNHPSAGMVYDAVHEKYPGISRATVYRILADAAEEGSIRRLKLRDANDRFDFTLTPHRHVTCKVCGHVADVDVSIDESEIGCGAVAHESFTLLECHIEFFGICEKCARAQKAN